MKKKIYPYLIEEQKMNNYYESLLNNKYKVRLFSKKKANEVYRFFLPGIRNLLFWSYNLTENNIYGANIKEFDKMNNELKSAVCRNYYCNFFEKGETIIIAFKNGICFCVTDNQKEAEKIKKNKYCIDMQEINFRNEDSYNIPSSTENDECLIYLYIIQLYKMIFLNKIQKEIQKPSQFDKKRNEFVRFVEQIYHIRATDDKDAVKKCEKWEKDLGIEKSYINVDNEFDLLYKNNKLNENNTFRRVSILVSVAAIIVGIINLWGMIQ